MEIRRPAVISDGLGDALVLFGEAHELEADGIDDGASACLDDVVKDADGGPASPVVAPLDEHADLGGGPPR